MVSNEEKTQFLKKLTRSLSEHPDYDKVLTELHNLLLSDSNNGKLYKFRSINKNSLSNLKSQTLHCSKPSIFNDPFDCRVGLDLLSFFNAKSDFKFEKIDGILSKFSKVYKGSLSLEECPDNEKNIIEYWLNSKSLCNFIDNNRGKNLSDEEQAQLLYQNFDAVKEVLYGIISDEMLREQLEINNDLIKKLYDNMTPETFMQLSDDNSTYEMFAQSIGVDDDADGVSLNNLIYQKYNLQNADVAIQMDNDFTRIDQEMSKMIDGLFYVVSLCNDFKNRLMWSHYADNHSGFCIEYDFSKEKGINQNLLTLPVIYSKVRPKFPWKAFMDAKNLNTEEASAEIMLSVLTKDDVWSYENEWRILVPVKLGEENIQAPPISCIYLGALCNEQNKATIISIANKLKVPVKQMVVDRGEYMLHAQSIK